MTTADVPARTELVLRWPEQCTEAVTRHGDTEPCDRVAVAVRRDPLCGDLYPVCAKHTRERRMLPLSAVLRLGGGGAA